MSEKNYDVTIIHCPECNRGENVQAISDVFGGDVTVWRGCHGKTWGLKTVHPYREDNPRTNYTIKQSDVSLIVNWVSVLQHLLHGSDKRWHLVLEDDAQVSPSVLDFLATEQANDDLDLIYLGWLDSHPRYKTQVRGDIYRLSDVPFGTQALWINHRTLPWLIESNQIAWAPIDIQLYKRSLPSINWAAVYPSLIPQSSQQ